LIHTSVGLVGLEVAAVDLVVAVAGVVDFGFDVDGFCGT
jgi:hypothetical protein